MGYKYYHEWNEKDIENYDSNGIYITQNQYIARIMQEKYNCTTDSYEEYYIIYSSND